MRRDIKFKIVEINVENNNFESLVSLAEVFVTIQNLENLEGTGEISVRNCTHGATLNGGPTQIVSLDKYESKQYRFQLGSSLDTA